MVVSMFWLGWFSWTSIHPVVPSLGGFLFILGFQLLFHEEWRHCTESLVLAKGVFVSPVSRAFNFPIPVLIDLVTGIHED